MKKFKNKSELFKHIWNTREHVSEIRGASEYMNGQNAWKMRDGAVGRLAEGLMKLLNIPIVTNSALRLRVEQLEKQNEFLRFMVDNGLGDEDLQNDITMPQER